MGSRWRSSSATNATSATAATANEPTMRVDVQPYAFASISA
jgi:hypothetical protein